MKSANRGAAEAPTPYLAVPDTRRQREDATIRRALSILSKRMAQPGEAITSPQTARTYLQLAIAEKGHEVFVVLFLDVRNRVVACEEMFRGTLTQTSVYPREVVKAALRHNANGVMLCHNHPSGLADPSEADFRLTQAISQALALIDVRTLDHFIVTASSTHSFAEHGQL